MDIIYRIFVYMHRDRAIRMLVSIKFDHRFIIYHYREIRYLSFIFFYVGCQKRKESILKFLELKYR